MLVYPRFRSARRLLSQSHASVRQKRKYNEQKEREVTWTKALKFAGQATFNLNRNMVTVPSSKPADRGVECQATTRSAVLAESGHLHSCSNNNFDFNSIQVDNKCGLVFNKTKSSFMSGLFDFTLTTLATGEDTLASLLEESKAYEAELMHYNPLRAVTCPPKLVMLAQICHHLKLWSMDLRFDHQDPRTYRIACLRSGLYASVQRILGHLLWWYPCKNGKLLKCFNMPAAMWKECVYDFMEALKYRKTDQIHLDSVKKYLLDAKDIVRSLQRDAPHLHKYWSSYLAGLDHYIDCLEQIREGRTDWSHPDVYDGDPEQQTPKLPDLSLLDTNMETLHFRGQGDHIDHNNHQSPRTYLGSLFTALSDRPAIADIALRGWTVFGQAIADTSNQYYQMYKILSFTSLPQLYRGCTDVLKLFLSSDYVRQLQLQAEQG